MLRAAVHRAAAAVADATAPPAPPTEATPRNAAAALGAPAPDSSSRELPSAHHGLPPVSGAGSGAGAPARADADAEDAISLVTRSARRRRRRRSRRARARARRCAILRPRVQLPSDSESGSQTSAGSDPDVGWTSYLTCGLVRTGPARRGIYLSESESEPEPEQEQEQHDDAPSPDPRPGADVGGASHASSSPAQHPNQGSPGDDADGDGDAQLFDDATIARLHWSLAHKDTGSTAATASATVSREASPAPSASKLHSPPPHSSSPSRSRLSSPPPAIAAPVLTHPQAPSSPAHPNTHWPEPTRVNPPLVVPQLHHTEPLEAGHAAVLTVTPDMGMRPSSSSSDYIGVDVDELSEQGHAYAPEMHLDAHSVTLDARPAYSPLPRHKKLFSAPPVRRLPHSPAVQRTVHPPYVSRQPPRESPPTPTPEPSSDSPQPQPDSEAPLLGDGPGPDSVVPQPDPPSDAPASVHEPELAPEPPEHETRNGEPRPDHAAEAAAGLAQPGQHQMPQGVFSPLDQDIVQVPSMVPGSPTTSSRSRPSSQPGSKSSRRKTRSKTVNSDSTSTSKPRRKKKDRDYRAATALLPETRRFMTEAEAEAAAGGFDLTSVPAAASLDAEAEAEAHAQARRDEFGFTRADLDRAQADYEAQADLREMQLAQREQAWLRGEPPSLSPTYAQNQVHPAPHDHDQQQQQPIVHHHYFVPPATHASLLPTVDDPYAPPYAEYGPDEQFEYAHDLDDEQDDSLTRLPDPGIDYEHIGVLPDGPTSKPADPDHGGGAPGLPTGAAAPDVHDDHEDDDGDLAGLGFSAGPKRRRRSVPGGTGSSSATSSRGGKGGASAPASAAASYLAPSSRGSAPSFSGRSHIHERERDIDNDIDESGTALSSAPSVPSGSTNGGGGAGGGGGGGASAGGSSHPRSGSAGTSTTSHRYPRLAAAQKRRTLKSAATAQGTPNAAPEAVVEREADTAAANEKSTTDAPADDGDADAPDDLTVGQEHAEPLASAPAELPAGSG